QALGEEARAADLARRAVALLEDRGRTAAPTHRLSYAALGQSLVREGRLEEAAAVLARGIEPQLELLYAWPVLHALALLALAALHQAKGDLAAVLGRLEEARAAVRGCRDAGMLPQ